MDAAKDLADSAKVFVRDGNTVRPPSPLSSPPTPPRRGPPAHPRVHSPAVHQPLHKAKQEGSVPSPRPRTRPAPADARLVPPLSLPYRVPSAEYAQICRAVAIGFAMMGGIGYLVKLIHVRPPSLSLSLPPLPRPGTWADCSKGCVAQIPINNILVGGA